MHKFCSAGSSGSDYCSTPDEQRRIYSFRILTAHLSFLVGIDLTRSRRVAWLTPSLQLWAR
ncbi:hypothetical protein EJB05_24499, partial [Eragrostis curvula]